MSPASSWLWSRREIFMLGLDFFFVEWKLLIRYLTDKTQYAIFYKNVRAQTLWPVNQALWFGVTFDLFIEAGFQFAIYVIISVTWLITFGRGGAKSTMGIFLWLHSPSAPRPSVRVCSFTFRHTTLGRTPLDEWPARRRDLYLTSHNTHNRQTSMLPRGIQTRIPASERP
jgi:hypothetical protein